MIIGESKTGNNMPLKKTRLGKWLQLSFGRLFSRLPLSPNQITILAIVFALIGFYFAYLQLPLHSLCFFILAGATDAIDGAVARFRRQATAKGAYIDGITDRLVEFLWVLSFFFYSLPSFILPAGLSLIIFLFFGTCMTSFATAYAEHRHIANSQKISHQPGILPRAERLLLLFAALLFIPFYSASASFILLAGAVLAFITFSQRFFYFAK